MVSSVLKPTIIRPTLILIHGGWQSPETFLKIIPGLEKAGYSVFAPRLPSSGTTGSFEEDVKIIRHTIDSVIETGKEVVLVMHSYGGVVGCEAMNKVKVKEKPNMLQTPQDEDQSLEDRARNGGVIKLVFIAAMLLPVGGSVWPSKRGNSPIPGFSYKVSQHHHHSQLCPVHIISQIR